jgi:hypothetical protein
VLEFTATGYIEVRLAGALVSKHRAEREAVESIAKHCAGGPTASYELTYPRVIVKYTAPAGPPPAPPAPPVTGSIDCPVAELPAPGSPVPFIKR